ncbi:hypothetical protein H1W37_14550 [Stappia taiwanensis]|uniref:Inner membrane protein n=1 Tax=Stappia taiwanensis TaxID=992267 RepID=A0A838XV24_9HYPH|nr:mitofilin family membrane protein [Stappia taiwanensis]MBA4612881.1 hypothetical protein [Stappia taiwanensis]GGF07095.1 hypothetical protein GCM10007285_38760 [Stappia taiwanensis]
MAADSKKPDSKGASGKAKPGAASASGRKPVTIDLEAREVKGGAAAKTASGSTTAAAAARGASASAQGKTPAQGKAASPTTGQTTDQATSQTTASKAAGGKTTAEKPASDKPAAAKPTGAQASSQAASAKPAATVGQSAATGAAASASGASTKPGSGTSASGTSASGTASSPKAAGAGQTETTKDDKSAAAAEKPTSSGAAPAKEPVKTEPAARQSGSGIGGLLIAALAGGAVALGGAYGLQRGGYLPTGSAPAGQEMQAEVAATQSRIAGLEDRLAELAKGGDTGTALTALTTRVAALEAAVKSAEGAGAQELAARVAEVEAGLGELRRFVSSGGAGETAGLASLQESQAEMDKTLGAMRKSLGEQGERIAALATSVEPLGARLDQTGGALAGLTQTVTELGEKTASLGTKLEERAGEMASLATRVTTLGDQAGAAREALGERLATLEGRLAPLEEQLGGIGARETAARAIAVSTLKATLDQSRPFETELAAVASALPKDTDLSALRAVAKTGVATRQALLAEFPPVARAMTARLDKPAQGDFVDSFLSNARSLVSIRQPGESDAATPEGALGRMEARVARGDLAGALEAYDSLPENVRSAGADWAAAARARLAADRLLDQVTGEVLSSLSGSGG